MHLKTLLEDIGLKNKEAQTYLALLELGASPAGAVARKTGLKRTSIYDIMKTLRAKGVVIITLRKNKKIFLARQPEQLTKLWKRRVRALEDALPQFNLIEKQGGARPHVTFLEGVPQVKEFYRTILEDYKGKSYDVIGNTETFLAWDPEFFDEYRRLRARANIKTRLILTQEKASLAQKTHEKILKNEIRFFPKQYRYDNLIRIYPDKVLFLSTKETNIGILIESGEFVDSFKKMFEFMWGVLDKS
ncbi:MAG TPA: hypothetical protein DDW36_01410 [Candidatus Magasanikbacteria bacterium]|nr:hypothetical protein [Candidatus Magasanikbacteria bacterium]